MGKTDVVILGAGVIGLSIALELEEAGYKVAIVAKDTPEDPNSTGFASPWAGCNWHTFEDDGDSPAAKRDAKTYKRLEQVAKEYPDLCEKIEFVDVFSNRVPASSRWNRGLVGGIREVTLEEYPIPAKFPHALIWSSFIIHAPNYILHLFQLVQKRQIPIIKRRISSIEEVYDIPPIGEVGLVINSSGMGSSSLIGVSDPLCYPARGQTVLVKAPKVRRCIMNTESFMGDDGDVKPAYIIPRPGCDQVILGGTYIPNNYSSQPDLNEADRILKACFDLEPELSNTDDWRGIEVVSHNVGLRPAREGGARVELDTIVLGSMDRWVGKKPNEERRVGIVHAYGFGSAGFQASLGAAEEVKGLVDRYFSETRSRGGRESKL